MLIVVPNSFTLNFKGFWEEKTLPVAIILLSNNVMMWPHFLNSSSQMVSPPYVFRPSSQQCYTVQLEKTVCNAIFKNFGVQALRASDASHIVRRRLCELVGPHLGFRFLTRCPGTLPGPGSLTGLVANFLGSQRHIWNRETKK